MAEDRDRWKVFVKAVMNLLEYGYFNDYMGLAGFSSRTLLRGVNWIHGIWA